MPNQINDPVNHPAHYTDGCIEVIDFIEDKNFGFHLGNAIKYISRAGKKDPEKEIEDLEKAVWYLQKYIIWKNTEGRKTMLKIRIKYLRDIDPVVAIPNGDWIDLRCAETVKLEEGQYAQIPLGIAMQLPEGYEAIVAPRSSTFKKYGILMSNSIGIIDETYCGDGDEWSFPAYATRDTVIHKNERICQFRILAHQPAVVLSPVDALGSADRGGFGSTGRV